MYRRRTNRQSNRQLFFVAGVFLLAGAGCSGMPPAQIGQVAGTIIGTAVAPGVGAPIGSLLGTLTGMVFQGQVDKQTEKKERVVLGQDLERSASQGGAVSTASGLSGPSRRVWIDETVEAGRIIPGHFEYRNVN